jgi:hypothetical protein
LGSESNFVGQKALYLAADKKIPQNDVNAWLKLQPIYQRYAKRSYKIPTRRIMVYSRESMLEMDLGFIGVANRKYRQSWMYLLVINAFTKVMHVAPLANKKSDTVFEAFKKLVALYDHKFKIVRSDRGFEFVGVQWKNYFKTHSIKRVYSTRKRFGGSSIAERALLSFKMLLQKSMETTGDSNWLSHYKNVVAAYNGRQHSSIQMSPNDGALLHNNQAVFAALYGPKSRYTKNTKISKLPALERFDYVRISLEKIFFGKESVLGTHSKQKYRVESVDRKTRPYMYILKNLDGDLMPGKYYRAELLKTTSPDYIDRKIEKIIQDGPQKTLVKWQNFPEAYNSFVPTKDVHRLLLH